MDRGVQHVARGPSLRSEWRSLILLALWFVGAALAVGASRNVPVVDDWTYAYSVERLLQDGRLEVLDWSAVYPLGHTLWGAAWSAVLGFSFATLRLSTLALGLVASGALFFILRELDAPPHLAVLGALSVAANPVFLLLSSSFMTDVPFVAFTLVALLYYVRAMRRGESHLLWWGGAWACAAFLDRQIAFITPLAALPLLVANPPIGTLKRSKVTRSLAATWGAMLVGLLVVTSAIRPTAEMTKLIERLGYLQQIPLATYLRYNLHIFSTVAFYTLPALVAMASVHRLWRTRTLVVLVPAIAAVMLVVIGEIPLPLRPGSGWSLAEVGGSRALINGQLPTVQAPWLELVLRGAGLLAAGLALLSIVRRDQASPRTIPVAPEGRSLVHVALDALQAIPITPRAPLIVYLVAYLLLVNALWMYNDRYLLVLLPVIAALALGHRVRRTGVPRLAWAATAVFAVVAIAGTRDALRFNQAVRDSWQALVDSGVQPSDIDAGYAWTGWVLYAHPENLATGLTINDVPWVTSTRRLPYILSKTRLDGYDITREVTWNDHMPWPGPDRLFVLERRAGH